MVGGVAPLAAPPVLFLGDGIESAKGLEEKAVLHRGTAWLLHTWKPTRWG